MIKTENLTKEYEGFTAVKHLSLEIHKGEIFGLLGPNGAGKTTTILMLLGLLPPTIGDAWIDGYSVDKAPMEVRSRASLVPDNLGLYDELTARQNLYFTAELNGIKGMKKENDADELLEKVGLKEWGDVKVGKFSRGMKQRLGIADALIKKPKVLILDEPTAGIDPEGVEQILTMIRSLSRDEEVTVLLSSHLLYQVQKVCDRVGIMSKGELVAIGSIGSLAKEEHTIEVELDRYDRHLINSLRKIEGVSKILERNNKILVIAEKDVRREVSTLASKGGYLILEIRLKAPSLDELYLKYFGG